MLLDRKVIRKSLRRLIGWYHPRRIATIMDTLEPIFSKLESGKWDLAPLEEIDQLALLRDCNLFLGGRVRRFCFFKLSYFWDLETNCLRQEFRDSLVDLTGHSFDICTQSEAHRRRCNLRRENNRSFEFFDLAIYVLFREMQGSVLIRDRPIYLTMRYLIETFMLASVLGPKEEEEAFGSMIKWLPKLIPMGPVPGDYSTWIILVA